MEKHMNIKQQPIKPKREEHLQATFDFDYGTNLQQVYEYFLKYRPNLKLEDIKCDGECYYENSTYHFVVEYQEPIEDFNKRMEVYKEQLKKYNEWYEANKNEIEAYNKKRDEQKQNKLLKRKQQLEKELNKIKKEIK